MERLYQAYEAFKAFGQKVALSLLGVLVAGIPTILWLLARWMLSPEGFWQETVLLGIGLYVAGGLQLILFFVLCWWLYMVWTDL